MERQARRESNTRAKQKSRRKKAAELWEKKSDMWRHHARRLKQAYNSNNVRVLMDDEFVDAEDISEQAIQHVMRKADGVYKLLRKMINNGPKKGFYTAVDAVCADGGILHCSPRSLRQWFYEFNQLSGFFKPWGIGKHTREWILDNEDWRQKALSFIRTHSQRKGQPNMRIVDF